MATHSVNNEVSKARPSRSRRLSLSNIQERTPDLKKFDIEIVNGVRMKYNVDRYDEYAEFQYQKSRSQLDASDVRSDFEEGHSRKRMRSATPEDDYPIPLCDRMDIAHEENVYIGSISGRQTDETPVEYWAKRKKLLRQREKRRIADEEEGAEAQRKERRLRNEAQQAAFNEARKARRLRDEEDMYKGLKSFNDKQRGWNGQRETERQESIKYIRAQAEKENMKPKDVAQRKENRPNKRTKTTDASLATATQDWLSQQEVNRVLRDGDTKSLAEDAYRVCMSRKWDVDAIKAAALEGQRLSTTSTSPQQQAANLESPPHSPRPSIERNSQSIALFGVSNDTCNASSEQVFVSPSVSPKTIEPRCKKDIVNARRSLSPESMGFISNPNDNDFESPLPSVSPRSTTYSSKSETIDIGQSLTPEPKEFISDPNENIFEASSSSPQKSKSQSNSGDSGSDRIESRSSPELDAMDTKV